MKQDVCNSSPFGQGWQWGSEEDGTKGYPENSSLLIFNKLVKQLNEMLYCTARQVLVSHFSAHQHAMYVYCTSTGQYPCR